MAVITIKLNDEAKALAEKHAAELGYHDAADLAFELLRNHCAARHDALYERMHIGEHNHVFGRSRREQDDFDRREAARLEQEERDRKKAEEDASREEEDRRAREVEAADFERAAEQAREEGRQRALEKIRADAEAQALAGAKKKK